MTVQSVARAKVNLALGVTGRRSDGYHEVDSVFLRVGLADTLTVDHAPAGVERDRLTVRGDVDCPVEGNLVLRAADLVREHAGTPLPPLDFTLTKDIPLEAGLGGGSADAAAALSLACGAWGVPGPDLQRGVAMALGADVPFFVEGIAAARVSGIGERIERLPAPAAGVGLLIVTPATRLSTAAVYRAFDELTEPAGDGAATARELADALARGVTGVTLAAEWVDRLAAANDLWPATLRVAPSLQGLRSDLEEALQSSTFVTGSGPTLVALYPSADEAAEAGRTLVAALPASLEGSRIAATDSTGPHPIWRYA